MDKVESNDERIPGSVDNEFKLEDLEEFVWRWKNHKKMLRIIYESNIDKEIIARWEAQIDECFREKIKSSL
jgi:hypothetical protein